MIFPAFFSFAHTTVISVHSRQRNAHSRQKFAHT